MNTRQMFRRSAAAALSACAAIGAHAIEAMQWDPSADANVTATADATLTPMAWADDHREATQFRDGTARDSITAIGTGLPDASANAFVIDPLNHNDLYIGTDRGVFNSPDGGTTWTQYGNGLPNVAVFDLAVQKKFGILRAATHGKGMFEIALALPRLRNISTRAFVQTGDRVAIGGFIISGSGAKKVLIRAIGPSLTGIGITGALVDPTLELHDSTQALIASNDNWKRRPDGSSQQAEIEATGIPPTNDLESALLQTLPAGNYTAIVRGMNGTTGVGLVEAYNLP